MASFLDIPETLRDVSQADAFVVWLINLPVTFDVRRALAHLWEAHNNATLLNADWLSISQAPDISDGV